MTAPKRNAELGKRSIAQTTVGCVLYRQQTKIIFWAGFWGPY